jgi:MFS family permease
MKSKSPWLPWLVWTLSSTFLFYKYVLQVSPTVIVPELMHAFSLSGASVGNLAAFYFYAYLSMQLPVGILLDTFNPKRLVAWAVAVCALGALLFSQAHNFTTAAIGRLLIGFGGAFSAVGTMKLITLWFEPKRFALLSGLMMTVGMLGAVGGEAPLAWLIEHHGWRTTLSMLAVAGFVLAIVIAITVPTKQTQHARLSRQTIHNFMLSCLTILRNRRAWLLALYSGLAFAPVSVFAGFWGIPFLETFYGLSRPTTSALVSLVFVGFAAGAPLAGWLSDYLERRKPIMVVGSTLAAALLLVIIYVPHISLVNLGILLFAFGFLASFFFVSFAMMREINKPQYSGTAIGFINMFNAIFGALAEPAIGKLLDLEWQHLFVNNVRVFSVPNYQHAISILPAGMLVGLVLLFFVPETHCKGLQSDE